jgi:hypothetical protein
VNAAITAAATPDATESVAGKAEIATQTETNTGTDDTRIVTPKKLKTFLDAAIAAIPAADGSETKVEAGTNVTVTGSGTTADPYVVNGGAPGLLWVEALSPINYPNGFTFESAVKFPDTRLNTQSALTYDSATGVITATASCVVTVTTTLNMTSNDGNVATGARALRQLGARLLIAGSVVVNPADTRSEYLKTAATQQFSIAAINTKTLHLNAGNTFTIGAWIQGPELVKLAGDLQVLVYPL